MKISVIIPCKNEAAYVPRLLSSLQQQTRPVYEVIVVDSGSTDATVATARSYTPTLPLKIVTAPSKGVIIARNFGATIATGDMLLFVDADAKLPPHFIAALTAYIARRPLQAGGFTQRMTSRRPLLRLGARCINAYLRVMQHTPWPIAFSCLFATRAVHEAIGGFDPEIVLMEDYDYVYRAKKSGFRVGIVPHPFLASDRRFMEHGSASSIFKAIYAEAYRYTHGMRVTKQLFTYETGGKTQAPDAESPIDRTV